MDKRTHKAVKAVFYISSATALTGTVIAAVLFKGPTFIGAFFGLILGFFFPWVLALISYSIYMMSNPAAAFKDEIYHLNKQQKRK